MPSARAAHASTQGQEEREDADSPKTPRSKGILAQLQTELRKGPPPGDNKEEEELRRALLASVVPLSFECQAGSPTAVGEGDTAGSHDSWSVVDGPSVAHGFDERPGQSPAPMDAEDSAPFRAPADKESEEEGPVEIEIDWVATMQLRKVLAWDAATQKFHLLLSSASSSRGLQAKVPQQRQQQQQRLQQQQPPQQRQPCKGAPWAPSVTRVTARLTATRKTRNTISGCTSRFIAEMRNVNALNLEPGKISGKAGRLASCHDVDGFGKGPKGP